MKVIVISSESASSAQKKINDFMQENNFEIIDIKWSVSDRKYSALIMYK